MDKSRYSRSWNFMKPWNLVLCSNLFCSRTWCKCSCEYVTLVYLSAAISMHKVRPVLYYTLGSSVLVGLSSSSSLSVDPSSLESNKKIGRRQSQFMRDFGQGAQDKSSHIHTNHSSLVLFQTKDKDRRVVSSCGSEESWWRLWLRNWLPFHRGFWRHHQTTAQCSISTIFHDELHQVLK